MVSYQEDLTMIQERLWRRKFPQGAQLLTYLYKLLLCCDSYTDKQTSNLLQEIFVKSLGPVLSMINSFLFTGDFEDPYEEFFVRKIFRRKGLAPGVVATDYMFMFTSEPDRHVPVFLLETAPLIYKAGSSLHLLQRKELFNTAGVGSDTMRLYYQICSENLMLSNSQS